MAKKFDLSVNNEIIYSGSDVESAIAALREKVVLNDKVGKLEQGERFMYGGFEWVKLADRVDGGCLVLMNEWFMFESEFDKDNSNNWANSSLRREINTFDESAKIPPHRSVKKDDLIEFERDLTTDDGMTDYGTCADLFSLLTCEEYRRFRKFIPPLDDWYWTITADSIVFPSVVRFVRSDGSLTYSGAYYGSVGVRPLCVLKSDVCVEKI